MVLPSPCRWGYSCTTSWWVYKAIKTQFDVINAGLTREEQEARLDVRYQKPSGKHVIIELKRGDRTVKFIELIAQVDKYFSALTKILKKHDTDEDFEIIVLLGKRLDGEKVDHDIESKHLRQLAEVNTRILYYDQLLANAETLYADFIAKNSSLASLETLINSIGWFVKQVLMLLREQSKFYVHNMFPDHCALRQSSVDNALMRIAHDIRLEYPFGAEPLPKLHILWSSVCDIVVPWYYPLGKLLSICHALYAWREVFILNHHSNDVNRFLYPELRLSSRSVDKGTEHSAPLSALFYFLPFFPRLPFFSSDGLPLPLPSFINLFASSISSFISTINTFSFSSHSSRVRA